MIEPTMSQLILFSDMTAGEAARDNDVRVNERCVAMVIMLLILSLTTALGLGMYVSANSDLMINGFYRNFHGSFYGADSGLNVARAQLLNQIVGAVPSTFAVPPIANPDTVATNAANYLSTHYGSFLALNSGQAANSCEE